MDTNFIHQINTTPMHLVEFNPQDTLSIYKPEPWVLPIGPDDIRCHPVLWENPGPPMCIDLGGE